MNFTFLVIAIFAAANIGYAADTLKMLRGCIDGISDKAIEICQKKLKADTDLKHSFVDDIVICLNEPKIAINTLTGSYVECMEGIDGKNYGASCANFDWDAFGDTSSQSNQHGSPATANTSSAAAPSNTTKTIHQRHKRAGSSKRILLSLFRGLGCLRSQMQSQFDACQTDHKCLSTVTEERKVDRTECLSSAKDDAGVSQKFKSLKSCVFGKISNYESYQ
jgi:hypothetical protein